ncbi:MAG: ATP-binding cassette domain-containing protein [Olsenella sp.]|jgi:ABC-2 type transport system ATP-binding protein|nr:ATP-binding cassette domain-containing protein [Olsenella sp.]
MSDNILEVHDLRKTYHKKGGGDFEAVRGISFDVPCGEVFGFLGPNGAGKSTTISMLTTQLEATGGQILLDGRSVTDDPVGARAEIGVVAQHNNLDCGLTARENLIFHARYFGMSRRDANAKADERLEKFGLADRQNDYVRSYSGGMAQRLKIARAMMHTPKILFLDEPTTGLDPNYREILWREMLNLNREAGTTIFLTTHYMEEPERLARHMVIVNHGQIVAKGTSPELKALVPTSTIVTMRLSRQDEEIVRTQEATARGRRVTRQAFLAMVQRDLLIQARDIWEFVFRVAMLPFILILTYGFVLPTLGVLPESFPSQMFAGMVGMSMLITGIHGTAVPLTMDFNNLHEIEDRLLAPVSSTVVALAKMLVGIIESFVGGLIVLPISLLFMGSRINVTMGLGDVPALIGILVLISLASATLGLLVGTIIRPTQIVAMFPGFLMPVVFLGAIFFS